MKRCAFALCTLVACGDDGMSMSTEPDAALGPDGIACSKPALDAPWLQTYVSGIVAGIPSSRATLTQRNAARTYLHGQLTQLGWTAQQHTYSTGANVYATISATTADTHAVIVGAHFDTVMNSPGANDNASGVAAVLAVARSSPATRHSVPFGDATTGAEPW